MVVYIYGSMPQSNALPQSNNCMALTEPLCTMHNVLQSPVCRTLIPRFNPTAATRLAFNAANLHVKCEMGAAHCLCCHSGEKPYWAQTWKNQQIHG